VDKRLANVPEDFVPRARDKAALYHAFAFALCAVEAERYMRTVASDEVAQMVAENNTDTHKAVKAMHKILRGEWGPELFATMDEQLRANFPIRRIVDCVTFAETDDAIFVRRGVVVCREGGELHAAPDVTRRGAAAPRG
jgi:hypothetical protein